MFGIRHILIVTAFVAAITSCLTLGELGISLIPLIAFSGIAMFLTKTRYSCAIQKWSFPISALGMIATVFSLPLLLYEIGWWLIPLNVTVVLIGIPALLMISAVLNRSILKTPGGIGGEAILDLTRMLTPWFAFTMLQIARVFGNPIPLA